MDGQQLTASGCGRKARPCGGEGVVLPLKALLQHEQEQAKLMRIGLNSAW